MDQHAPQREHDLREVFNALRWLVRAGAPWRMLAGEISQAIAGLRATARSARRAAFPCLYDAHVARCRTSAGRGRKFITRSRRP